MVENASVTDFLYVFLLLHNQTLIHLSNTEKNSLKGVSDLKKSKIGQKTRECFHF